MRKDEIIEISSRYSSYSGVDRRISFVEYVEEMKPSIKDIEQIKPNSKYIKDFIFYEMLRIGLEINEMRRMEWIVYIGEQGEWDRYKNPDDGWDHMKANENCCD